MKVAHQDISGIEHYWKWGVLTQYASLLERTEIRTLLFAGSKSEIWALKQLSTKCRIHTAWLPAGLTATSGTILPSETLVFFPEISKTRSGQKMSNHTNRRPQKAADGNYIPTTEAKLLKICMTWPTRISQQSDPLQARRLEKLEIRETEKRAFLLKKQQTHKNLKKKRKKSTHILKF